MPLLYKLIQEERCFSRWLEKEITGFNSKHSWNLHRIPHLLLNGTLIGSVASIIFILLAILKVI